jgi:hypothetical protein
VQPLFVALGGLPTFLRKVFNKIGQVFLRSPHSSRVAMVPFVLNQDNEYHAPRPLP